MIQAFTCVLTLDELLYRLLLAQIKDNIPGNPIEVLRKDQANLLKQFAPLIKMPVMNLLSIPNFKVLGITLSDSERMLNAFGRGILMPRDCLHHQMMKRARCKAIASDDLSFDRIAGIVRYGAFRV